MKNYDPKVHIDDEEYVYVKFQRVEHNVFKGYTYKRVGRYIAETQLSLPKEERAHAWRGVTLAGDTDPGLDLNQIPGAQSLIDEEVNKRLAELKAKEEKPKKETKNAE